MFLYFRYFVNEILNDIILDGIPVALIIQPTMVYGNQLVSISLSVTMGTRDYSIPATINFWVSSHLFKAFATEVELTF